MPLPKLKSCGVLVFRDSSRESFLLMKHPDRWDLPKGHVDEGETEMQCAMRELLEETGIKASQIEIDSTYRYESHYVVHTPRYGKEPREKSLVVFLGHLNESVPIQVTEHAGHQWFDWPTGPIQAEAIDPLLEFTREFLSR